LAESGSVAFMFEHLGEINLLNVPSDEEQLKLIDLGANDIVGKQVYVDPHHLFEIVKKINDMGFKVESKGLIYKAKKTNTSSLSSFVNIFDL
jgi:transcriptional/translational regulatory protein YebC/TACO1